MITIIQWTSLITMLIMLMMNMLMVMNMIMVRTRGMTLEKEPTSGPASRVASRQANFSD